MSTLLLTHDAFKNHDTGAGHPERADRMRAIDKVLAHENFAKLKRAEAPLREDVEAQILLAHPESYLANLKSLRPAEDGASVRIDGDTVMSPGTWEAAARAVGAGLEAIDQVFDTSNDTRNAFCQVRPPGHHAEANRAMGFCLFSTAAITARYAAVKHGAERVAVVDFDVHHGNGTQDIFWTDKNNFYGSSHQMPLFPGTGAMSEVGVGNISNAPLAAGDDGRVFREAWETRILPALHNFGPDCIVISAGFDAHKDDPLASLALVEADFMWLTEALVELAEVRCGGRVVSLLEGGYDLAALARSTAVHVRTLMDAGG